MDSLQLTWIIAGLTALGVIVRPFQGDGVRVTIGTPEENDTFLKVAGEAL